MPFKPNYRQMRADRNRAKELRKQEKLLRRQDKAAKREGDPDESQPAASEPENT